MTQSEFTKAYGLYAVNAGKKYGLNPAVILAVASWESAYGSSRLATTDFNFFGIKAGSVKSTPHWNGKSRAAPDGGAYRQYANIQDSFLDFAYLMTKTSRYIPVSALSFDVEKFALAFINSGYMTGSKEQYRAAIISRAAIFSSTLEQLPIFPTMQVVIIAIGLILAFYLLNK